MPNIEMARSYFLAGTRLLSQRSMVFAELIREAEAGNSGQLVSLQNQIRLSRT